MPVTYFGFRILLLGLILAMNAFFAAAEVALLSVRESRLKQLAAEGEAGARMALQLLEHPENLLSMTQVGVTLASLGLGWAGEDTLFRLAQNLFHPLMTKGTTVALEALSFIIAFLVISYAHVVIGEVVPKNLAVAKADRLAIAVAPVLLLFAKISRPFVAIIEKSAAYLTRSLGVQSRHRGGHSPEELRFIVASSGHAGHLAEAQEDMIHRVLDLDQIAVHDAMIGRNDMVALSADATLDQVLATMIEQQHSRLPVYQGAPDHIVGVLYYKDLLPVWQERRIAIRAGQPAGLFHVPQLMRKHLVVPETKPLVQMLEVFRTGKAHIAMVVDEYGTITGLLTVEDVLEQIVGRIEDEYDEPASTPQPAEAGEFEIDGAMKIRDFEAQYNVGIPNDLGFETVGGFFLYKLGRIPKAGESFEFGGRIFTAVAVERNRIVRIKVERKPE